MFTHIETLLKHVQTYSGISSTLCNHSLFITLLYSESWHILNPRLIQNPVKSSEHIQNSDKRHYSDILCNACTFRTLCNACIRRNMAYSKSWNIQNRSITAFWHMPVRNLSYLWKFTKIQNPDIFKTWYIFRTLSVTYKEVFCKNSYFSKVFYLISLKRFQIRPSLNEYY